MSKKKLMKKALAISLSATMVFATGSSVYASTQALPNGTIVNQNGINYLTGLKGEKYSGWFKDSNEDWYYFNESDMSMATGWHHDDKDGYWYYLNLSDGKMATGWQTIDGKEYFFQPVRDMGNYNFNNEQEKWLYSMNSKVPYGAMYMNTTTPDGSKVDGTGAKVVTTGNSNQDATATAVKNGWVSQNGKWYYYESDVMAKSKWLNLSGKWYYVADDGVMVSNSWKEIGGKSYYFGSDGAMYVNATTPDGKKIGADGTVKVNTDYSSYIGTYESNDPEIAWTDHPSIVNVTGLAGGYISGHFEIPGTNDDGIYFDFKSKLNENGEFSHIYTREHNDPNTGDGDYGGKWEYKFKLSENNNQKVVILKKVVDLEKNNTNKYIVGLKDITYYATSKKDRTKNQSNKAVAYDYSNYIGIFNDGYDEETGTFGWSSGMEEFSITNIENNKIYGSYYHSSYAYDLYADFENGIPIIDNKFTISVEYTDNHNGESDYYTSTFGLGEKNGKPVILPDTNSSLLFYKMD